MCLNSKTWPKSFNLNDLFALYTEAPEGSATSRLVKRFFDVMDADGNGMIDFREYAVTSSMYFNHNERQKLTWLFALFDENSDGFIRREELVQIVEVNIHFIILSFSGDSAKMN